MKTLFFTLFIYFSCTAFNIATASDSMCTLHGIITDAEEKSPLNGVNVYFKNSRLGTMTHATGEYFFLRLPKSPDSLIIQMIGYKRIAVFWTGKSKIELNFQMESQPILLQQVIKEAERYTLLEPIVYRIDSEKILTIPSLAEPDIMRAVQHLPGVTRTDDFNATPYFHGGDAHQSGLFINEIPIFNAWHLAGFFSLIHPELIQSVEVKPGAYPVNYGNFLSGLVLTNFRPGSAANFKRSLSLSLIAARAMLEGPLPGKNNSFIISVRRTHLDAFNKPMQDNLFPYNFSDIQGRFDWEISQSDHCEFSYLYSYDKIKTDDRSQNCSWNNVLAEISWQHLFNSKFYSKTVLGGSSNHFLKGDAPADTSLSIIQFLYTTSYDPGDNDAQVRNRMQHLLLKHQFDYRLTSTRKIFTGIEMNQYLLDYHWAYLSGTTDDFMHRGVSRFFDHEPPFYQYQQNFNIYSAFLQYLSGLEQPFSYGLGIRCSKSELLAGTDIEPRFHFQYILNPELKLKGALGLYNQHLIAAKEAGGFDFDNDAVYYFYQLWLPVKNPHEPNQAIQSILVLEKKWGYHLKFTVQGYFNRFYNLLMVTPDMDIYPVSTKPDGYPLFSSGVGLSQGLELQWEYSGKKISTTINYTLAQSMKKFGETIFYSKQDQRHAIKCSANFQLSKEWIFSFASVFHSGLPYTPVIGKYSPEASHNWELIQGVKNSARLPDYYRLDIQFTRNTRITNKPAKLFISVQNISNQKNVLSYFYDNPGNDGYLDLKYSKNQLPILPSVGIIIYFGKTLGNFSPLE